jgi:methionyl-tRNA formyltransferase
VKVVLVSRFPRVDVPAWKRQLAQALVDDGHAPAVLYSRCGLVDHALAALEAGPADVVRRYARARRRPSPAPQEEAASTLAAWARERGAPVRCVRRLGDPEAEAALAEMAPDVVVLVGADIVPAALLRVPRLGTLNAHYGMLPAYRGMNAAEWSLYHGDAVGVTVHFVDPGIDTGDIVARRAIELGAGDTLDTLRAKQQDLACELLRGAVADIAAGTVAREGQTAADGRQYYRMHPELRRRVLERLAGSAG